MPSITIISDTHAAHRSIKIKPCEILLVAGDYSHQPTEEEFIDFLDWIRSQHEGEVVLISGNHDRFRWKFPSVFFDLINRFKINYLEHQDACILGVSIWGSPVTPPVLPGLNRRFEMTEENRQRIWNSIPKGIDIIMTHGPPYGILDESQGQRLGCPLLLNKVLEIKPKYHIFGHIHQSYGMHQHEGINFINSSIVRDDGYNQWNEPFHIVM